MLKYHYEGEKILEGAKTEKMGFYYARDSKWSFLHIHGPRIKDAGKLEKGELDQLKKGLREANDELEAFLEKAVDRPTKSNGTAPVVTEKDEGEEYILKISLPNEKLDEAGRKYIQMAFKKWVKEKYLPAKKAEEEKAEESKKKEETKAKETETKETKTEKTEVKESKAKADAKEAKVEESETKETKEESKAKETKAEKTEVKETKTEETETKETKVEESEAKAEVKAEEAPEEEALESWYRDFEEENGEDEDAEEETALEVVEIPVNPFVQETLSTDDDGNTKVNYDQLIQNYMDGKVTVEEAATAGRRRVQPFIKKVY